VIRDLPRSDHYVNVISRLGSELNALGPFSFN
jgi:hypothetical protein